MMKPGDLVYIPNWDPDIVEVGIFIEPETQWDNMISSPKVLVNGSLRNVNKNLIFDCKSRAEEYMRTPF